MKEVIRDNKTSDVIVASKVRHNSVILVKLDNRLVGTIMVNHDGCWELSRPALTKRTSTNLNDLLDYEILKDYKFYITG